MSTATLAAEVRDVADRISKKTIGLSDDAELLRGVADRLEAVQDATDFDNVTIDLGGCTGEQRMVEVRTIAEALEGRRQ